MKDRAAALRYTRALEAAYRDGEIATVADELAAMVEITARDATLITAMTSPAIDAEKKRALLDSLVAAARFSPKTAAFLKILSEHGHLGLLPEVATLVAQARDRRMGIVEARVTTPTPLDSGQSENARQALERATGRKVRLSVKTDPSLLGGLVAQVGSTVYDGSLRTRLEALRSRLTRN